MTGTYSSINFGEAVTPSFSKGEDNESNVDLAKELQAGLKRPAVSKGDNYKRIADAIKHLNNSK
jgi:hypothetical protein